MPLLCSLACNTPSGRPCRQFFFVCVFFSFSSALFPPSPKFVVEISSCIFCVLERYMAESTSSSLSLDQPLVLKQQYHHHTNTIPFTKEVSRKKTWRSVFVIFFFLWFVSVYSPEMYFPSESARLLFQLFNCNLHDLYVSTSLLRTRRY
ncbi:transmembrane protein, putative [Bodo saltans]|uniref:Transmembrane protein, putative n=1 Tax=Bodo saltans TaxID=75058 RepID=A0A0S4ISF3_BODSA|nr:transmembrane protein, putative [Bodo saltans]|eukprot:CUF62777.1 transmembrane protein, putative [Bodo saltans]